MINKYITATVLAVLQVGLIDAQTVGPMPKLVVSIAIDQLRTDYLETFMPYYSTKGFKKLLSEGTVYDNAQYTFQPVDRASAIASVFTGSTPRYNGIPGSRWLDKSTLVPVDCVDDTNYGGLGTKEKTSPENLTATTVGDELKISTDGKAMVYSIAKDRDAAVLGGGHAADGAFWIDKDGKCWCSSKFYFRSMPDWVRSYNSVNVTDLSKDNINRAVTQLALKCVSTTGMGTDGTPDILNLTYDACPPKGNDVDHKLLQEKYIQIDRELEEIISKLQTQLGKDNVMFVLTATGYSEDREVDYRKFRINAGTFYINRTANLLNMYLGAIYGPDKYVDGCYYNEIYLNTKKLDMKHISLDDVLARSQAFLMQNSGVANAVTRKDMLMPDGNSGSMLRNWYNANRCGEIVVEVTPGWKLLNEDNKQQYTSRASLMAFPIIIYGPGVAARHVTTPVTVDRIAPTVARTIRIRAPNACSATPLY